MAKKLKWSPLNKAMRNHAWAVMDLYVHETGKPVPITKKGTVSERIFTKKRDWEGFLLISKKDRLRISRYRGY